MAGGSGRFRDSIEMGEERIEKAFALAWKVHKSPDKHYLVEKVRRNTPSEVIISFPASGAVRDWYSGRPFGETKINLNLFPSLKNVGYNEAALVNEAFLQRFSAILIKSTLAAEVDKAMTKKKQILFTGHSSGAPMAILATLWTLDKYITSKTHQRVPPLCVTFGSPLVGNHIFSHATNRENWSRCFMHFVMRYDIVPRVFLAPLSSFNQRFEAIYQFFNPKSKSFLCESLGRATVASDFYLAVMTNAATVTSHAACKLMGSTHESLETLANFISLSPYRPFGTYIFCTENGKPIVIRNSDAVLQLMFFSAQLSTESEAAQVAYRGLREHIIYGTELKQNLGLQKVVYLDQLEKLPLYEDGSIGDVAKINLAVNELGLSTRARLCLRAAAEFEDRRCKNEDTVKKKIAFINSKMKELEGYREMWKHQKLCYYDAFKLQEHPEDFQANVKRLELAGVWDEIIEMLRRYELPDEFEGKQEWVEFGTRFRRLVEPLDIANYYRHMRQNEAGPYMGQGRPRRYKYTQRWMEHAERKQEEANSESSFWGEVEDLGTNISFEDVKERVLRLEVQIRTWFEQGVLAKDVLLESSTFVKWWRTLPHQHKQESCIRSLIN